MEFPYRLTILRHFFASNELFIGCFFYVPSRFVAQNKIISMDPRIISVSLCYYGSMRKIWIPLIVFGLLFVSSGQTYEQQSLIPLLRQWLPGEPLKGLLSHLEVPYWGRTVSIEERGYYYFVEFLIRKSAHFVMFGLLAVSFYVALPKWRGRFVLAGGLTVLAAMADEYRQSLTGGRTPSWYDVGLDAAGAFTFLVAFRIGTLLWRRRKRPAQ